jgi:hypothetical protein
VILIFNILFFGRWIKSIKPSPHKTGKVERGMNRLQEQKRRIKVKGHDRRAQ